MLSEVYNDGLMTWPQMQMALCSNEWNKFDIITTSPKDDFCPELHFNENLMHWHFLL